MTDQPSDRYDDTNIFARILRGEIPNKTVLDSDHTLVFHDINPAAPHHLLVIPKGRYVDYADFAAHASGAEIVDFHRAVAAVTERLGIQPGQGGAGFRAITNAGSDGVQEVPHFHLHILAGRPLGRMLGRPSE
ncbi:HIT domain-containing protein [Paracoccus sp. p4-l81]|uniref:HIT domain-containing protein n=1 Tax=unclassified Paracoccus (in: a-proteobacteria) TaxID=2688777 RepID=UPI0035B8D587